MGNVKNELNKKLQPYFDFWCKNLIEEDIGWFKSLTAHLEFIDELKKKIQKENISIKEDFEKILNEVLQKHNQVENMFCKYEKDKDKSTLEDFLNTYVYEADCGVGNIGQGNVYNTEENNPHQKLFNENIINNIKDFVKLFISENIIDVYNLINELFNENIIKNTNNPKDYNAAKHRLLRTLFPCKVTSIDSKDKFWSLITSIRNKLGIDLFNEGEQQKGYDSKRIHIEEILMDSIKCKNCHGDSNDSIECCALKQIFFWDLYESLLNMDFSSKKAKVYYGAPGTGKTYKAKKEAKKLIDNWKLKIMWEDNKNENSNYFNEDLIKVVQFHPSFGYEDFIEGLRPDENGNFKRIDGIFKDFCRKAGKFEIELWKDKGFREAFKDKDFCEIKVKEAKEKIENEILKKCLNKFNDNFTLEDIIKPAVFIIDEINRAEISKVFGELMYALEYRGYNGKIKTQYSYLKQDELFFEENNEDYFFVPHNVYIFATMNTIDRSVDIFDFAMRRRFEWEKVGVNYDVIKDFIINFENKIIKEEENKKVAVEIAKSLENLNEKIKYNPLLGEDYEIGHAYILGFLKCSNKVFESIKSFKEEIWNKNLEPLLMEYLKGLADNEEIKQILEEFEKAWGIK